MTDRLIYVSGVWAYFTSRPDWQQQWGDDWNDTPYECNAGQPYTWADYMECEPYQITKVAFEGPLNTPDWMFRNSPYSVQMINAGQVAWLGTSKWYDDDPLGIEAGATITDFVTAVKSVGGKVYMCER